MTEAEPRPTDEEILAFSQEVTASATTDVPLVGASSIASLQAEYSDNPIFRTKIDALVTASPAGKYYRTRGDGNCFYRAVITSLSFQLCCRDGLQRKEKSKERIGKTRPMLDRAGFSEIVYEDFMDTFLLLLDKDASVILEGLNDAETSNSAVVFLRLVTAAQIKTHPDVYLPFVDLSGGHGGQLDRWVERSVEAMDAEADNVQIHALVHALGLAVDVVNLDGTDGSEANVHHVRPDHDGDDVTTDVVIRVLYRPGHYDVLL